MQLKRDQLRKTLATATCGLLAATAQLQPVQAKGEKWDFSASTLLYTEMDRITVYEETLDLKKELGEDEFLSLKRTHDIMTGASPTGAAAPPSTQTFTTPSGSSVTNTAGDSPLADFRDIRTAYNVAWDKPLSRLLKSTWSANYSYEYDYASFGLGGVLNKDLASRQTTLTGGLTANYDRVRPTGGVPTGLAATTDTTRYPADQKLMTDWLFGISRVINRNTLGSMTYMGGFSSGYLTDPYKVVSRLNVDGTPSGSEQFENRPQERDYSSVHFRIIHYRTEKKYKGDVIDISYRYYQDSWDISSHTVDSRYRHDIKAGRKHHEFWQGHVRLYRQSAADFYTYGLPVLGTDPAFASADYRLATMATATLGLLYGRDFMKDVKVTVRGEYLRQWYMNGKLTPLNAFNVQASLYYAF